MKRSKPDHGKTAEPKAPHTAASPPAHRTSATKAAAAPPTFEPPDAQASLAWIRPRLAAVTTPRWFQVDVESVCVAVLGVCGRCADPALRARFEKLASIGEFDITALDDLANLAVGVRQLRIALDQAVAAATGTKLGAELVAEARAVEARMQAACEHTLADTPGAAKELARLSPGSGYKDDAGDLEGYAKLYDDYPDRVKLDGVNYRVGDVALARSLAKRILAALAAAETPATKAANTKLKQGATLLLDAYEKVAHAGTFLVGDDAADTEFPSLFAAGRAPKRARAKPVPPTPAPSPDPGGGAITATIDARLAEKGS